MFYLVSLNTNFQTRKSLSWFIYLATGVISIAISSVQAAERVEFGIDPIKFGVSVKELETYGKEERAGKELGSFLKLMKEDDRAKGLDPLKKYSHTFILALLQTHLNNQKAYHPYLQTGYVNAISAAPNKLTMLRSLTPQQFNNIL